MILLNNALTDLKELAIVAIAFDVKPEIFVQHATRNVVTARIDAFIVYLVSTIHGEEDAKATHANDAESSVANVFIVSDVLFGTGNDWKWICLKNTICSF